MLEYASGGGLQELTLPQQYLEQQLSGCASAHFIDIQKKKKNI